MTGHHPSRRELLSAIGMGMGTAIAGCSGDDSQPESPGPSNGSVRLTFVNWDSVEREYEVTIRQGNTVRETFSGTLLPDPAESPVIDSTVPISSEGYEIRITTPASEATKRWSIIECTFLDVSVRIEDAYPKIGLTQCAAA